MLLNIYRFVYPSIDLIGKTNITNLADDSNLIDYFTHLEITCFCNEMIEDFVEMMSIFENGTCFVVKPIFHYLVGLFTLFLLYSALCLHSRYYIQDC